MLWRLGLLLSVLSCATEVRRPLADPYIHLEAVKDSKNIEWVKAHNQASWKALGGHPLYPQIEKEVRTILSAKDRIPFSRLVDGQQLNFWQDQEHPRGVLRQTSLTDYRKTRPRWSTLMDFDALNKKEGKSWVYRGLKRPEPRHDIALMTLSDGGSDRAEVREFNLKTRQFVKDGFFLPVNKHRFDWVDENTLFVATDFGAGTLTDSGYPRQLKVWKRGTPLAEAKLLFEGKTSDMMVMGYRVPRPEGAELFVVRNINFYEEEVHHYQHTTGTLTRVPFPSTADFQGIFQGHLLAKLRHDWHSFKAGSLVSLDLSSLHSPDSHKLVKLVYEPDERSTLDGMFTSKSFLILNTLESVQEKLLRAIWKDGRWQLSVAPISGEVIDSNNFTDLIQVSAQDFTTPATLYLADLQSDKVEKLKTLPAQFDARELVTTQKYVTSLDGTQVPYFLVHKRGIKLDGKNPTLLYGYGGFEIALTPTYRGQLGKAWLERGGVYALANIRGGGEFGPRWHKAALKENRQRAYEDFYAVSEDLIDSGITSPRHLGIHGGSNGGLLVGVAFTQRPELYNAVICEVALLDMLRYHLLPPGASWMAEYGNPELREEAAYIAKYSPYQNLKPGVKYPKVFFYTSTGDDRVQPGHTRKMVARMQELGHDFYYYENIEGGHGGAADLEQSIRRFSLQYVYLWERLAR